MNFTFTQFSNATQATCGKQDNIHNSKVEGSFRGSIHRIPQVLGSITDRKKKKKKSRLDLEFREHLEAINTCDGINTQRCKKSFELIDNFIAKETQQNKEVQKCKEFTMQIFQFTYA